MKKYLIRIWTMVKLEPNRMVRNVQNFELYDKKVTFLKPFWQSVDAVLQGVCAAKTIV